MNRNDLDKRLRELGIYSDFYMRRELKALPQLLEEGEQLNCILTGVHEAERKMLAVMEIIRTIRNLRSEMNVAPSKRTRLMLLPGDGWTDTLKAGEGYFRKLAGASEVEILSDRNQVTEKTVSAVTAAGELFIPLGDLVDFEKEIARLSKELENLKKEMARSSGMLNNQGFLAKAPAQLVQQERDKLEAAKEKAAALENRIAELKG